MILQFFKTSCRIFIRERAYSLLNIIGLSVGMASALIIYIYLQDELNYDRYHLKARNIYRVNSIYVSSGKENKFALSPVSVGPKLKEEYPEVLAFTRMDHIGTGKLSYGENTFFEENLVVADSTFFEIFTSEFILGSAPQCFRSPSGIVLTEKLSRKYFGNQDPLGKILVLDKTQSFEVTGVIKDPPQNLHLKYDALIPVKRYDPKGNLNNSSLFDISLYTYLLLPEHYDIEQFYNKFPAFYEKHAAKFGKALNQEYKVALQPLLSIHFSKEWTYDLPNGNKTYIIAFLIIGLLLLTLSSINYLNLTTARSERRKKEISIKKVFGSKRSGMIIHFLGESMLMVTLGMLFALLLTWFILGFTSFDQLIDKNISIGSGKTLTLVIGILSLTAITGLSSGLYPAFYLSNLRPLMSLQKVTRSGIFAFSLRKLLVIVQMVISIGVVIFTLLFDRQIQYVRSMDIGINKENVMILPVRDTSIIRHINSLKEKLLQYAPIKSASTAYHLPGRAAGNLLYRVETDNGMEEQNFSSMFVNYDFIKTLGIKLLEGRDFSRDFSSDFRSSFIINETLARKMGWKEPIGKRLQQNFNADGKPYYDGVVIGIMQDFNYASLHNAIEPLVLRLQGREGGQLLLKLDGNNIENTVYYIEEIWQEYSDEFPTDYTFLDKNFDMLYKKDRQQNMLIKTFSWICILISILGLIGLASYITKNRTREIAIRKVYGASAGNILLRLYREIIVLVIMSAIIVTPVAYMLTKKVMNNFAYREEPDIYIFLLTITGAVIISLGVVSYHSLKASLMNPALSLKYE
jgi:putative ABC transport system permease protein